MAAVADERDVGEALRTIEATDRRGLAVNRTAANLTIDKSRKSRGGSLQAKSSREPASMVDPALTPAPMGQEMPALSCCAIAVRVLTRNLLPKITGRASVNTKNGVRTINPEPGPIG